MILADGRLAFVADDGPAMRMVGIAPVMLMSRRRMANTSPIRAEAPSITPTINPSCPSGLGPLAHSPRSQCAIAALTALTSTALSAVGVDGGRRSLGT